jgi:hypothetical protein
MVVGLDLRRLRQAQLPFIADGKLMVHGATSLSLLQTAFLGISACFCTRRRSFPMCTLSYSHYRSSIGLNTLILKARGETAS